MKEIVKVLLQEGIDEEVIHEVLSVIEENYEIVDEAGMLASALSGAMGNERNRQEYNRKLEQFSDKHPHMWKVANKVDSAVGGAVQRLQDTGKKVVDKVADTVTKSNDPISKGIRKTKIGQNTLGKVAMKNAGQAAQTAQKNLDWEDKRPGSAESKYMEGKRPALQKTRDNAVKNAVKTGSQWGKKFDTSSYK